MQGAKKFLKVQKRTDFKMFYHEKRKGHTLLCYFKYFTQIYEIITINLRVPFVLAW